MLFPFRCLKLEKFKVQYIDLARAKSEATIDKFMI